jgi:sugar transferase (PEP-CTERM/EpsH1 system associated)
MRVLYLTHRLPYAPNRGDRIRAYHTLRTLRGHAQVDLLSLVHDAEEAAMSESLRPLAETVALAPVHAIRNRVAGAFSLVTSEPLTHTLLGSPVMKRQLRELLALHRPDVVLAFGSGMARFALQPPLDRIPLVIDFVDIDSLKWEALSKEARAPIRFIYRREAKWLSRFEAAAARRAYSTTVVNEREKTALEALARDARIVVVPNGIDGEYFRPPSDAPSTEDVTFCGVMNYPPNEHAAIWLAREVWPLVRKRRVAARLQLVGSRPTARVRSLSAADRSVQVTGDVPDVRPHLWRAAIAVAPLRVARGVQNKVLEAVAAGLPTVITPAVADGLPAEILPACRVAGDAASFADAIVEWLELSPPERRRLAELADLSALAWDRQLAPLVQLLERAAAGHR